MSSPFPPLIAATAGDNNSIDSSLLTPPITPLDVHELPYRPSETDKTSLSMKSRRHKHNIDQNANPRIHSYKETSSTPLNDDRAMCRGDALISTSNLARGKSMTTINSFGSGSVSPTSINIGTKTCKKTVPCARRWTLPSKTTATRGMTPLRSVVKQSTWRLNNESPAMITLRRATTNRCSNRTGLTFFPEPTFSHERNGLLSYLVSTFTRARSLENSVSSKSTQGKACRRSASVSRNGAHPTLTFPAPTVFTETTIDAQLAMPDPFFEEPFPRRCSTKYISGDTTYEVLWDENDRSSNTQESSRPLTSNRRPSVAVMDLQLQLARGDSSTIHTSESSRKSSGGKSFSSANMFLERKITPSDLDQLFPRLLHKTGLRNLPRSRENEQRRGTVCWITVNEAQQQTLAGGRNSEISTSSADFSPPLRGRQRCDDIFNLRSGGFRNQKQLENVISTSDCWPRKKGLSVGSLIGSSSRVRRCSSLKVHATCGTGRRSNSEVLGAESDESESQPLLCTAQSSVKM